MPALLLGVEQAPPEHYFTLRPTDGYNVPLLKAFNDDADRIALQNARFQQYLRVDIASDAGVRKVMVFSPEVLQGSKVKVDHPLPLNEPAVVEWNPPTQIDDKAKPKSAKEKAAASLRGIARYRGKVVLLTTTVNLDWNTWAASPSFPAMMQELTRFAVSGRLRDQQTVVGNILEEVFPGGAELEGELLVPGEDLPQKVITIGGDDVSTFRWLDTDPWTCIGFTIGQDPQEYLFAVNVPMSVPDRKSSESDLTRTDKARLKAAYPGWDFQVVKNLSEVQHGGRIDSPDDSSEAAAPNPIGPFIAHYVLLAAIVLLFAEIILGCTFGHFTASARALGQAPTGLRLAPGLLGAGLAVTGVVVMVLGHCGPAVVHYWFTGDFLGATNGPAGLRGPGSSAAAVRPAAGPRRKHALDADDRARGARIDAVPAAGRTNVWPGIYRDRHHQPVRGPFRRRGYASRCSGNRPGGSSRLAFLVWWLWPQPEIHFERQTWPECCPADRRFPEHGRHRSLPRRQGPRTGHAPG